MDYLVGASVLYLPVSIHLPNDIICFSFAREKEKEGAATSKKGSSSREKNQPGGFSNPFFYRDCLYWNYWPRSNFLEDYSPSGYRTASPRN